LCSPRLGQISLQERIVAMKVSSLDLEFDCPGAQECTVCFKGHTSVCQGPEAKIVSAALSEWAEAAQIFAGTRVEHQSSSYLRIPVLILFPLGIICALIINRHRQRIFRSSPHE